MIVLKFGGTSVGSADAIRRIVKIVATAQPRMPVIVVSATSGTTDALIRAARRAETGDLAGAQTELADCVLELGDRLVGREGRDARDRQDAVAVWRVHLGDVDVERA